MSELSNVLKNLPTDVLIEAYTLIDVGRVEEAMEMLSPEAVEQPVHNVVPFPTHSPTFVGPIVEEPPRSSLLDVPAPLLRQKEMREELDLSREVDIEYITKQVMQKMKHQEEEHPTPPTRIAGAGAPRSMVNALEARIQTLESVSGVGGGVTYTPVTVAGTTSFTASQLPLGTNIIGVNASGPVTIRLPDTLTQGTIVHVNDESLNASANNITITTYIEG